MSMFTSLVRAAGLLTVFAACSPEEVSDSEAPAPVLEPAAAADVPESQGPAQPQPVTFEVVEEWNIPNGGRGRVLVVQLQDATPERLTALGEQLRA